MTAEMVMMKIVETHTPADMIDTVVQTLLCEENTHESIMYRFRTLLSGALIQSLMPPAHDSGRFYDIHRKVWKFIIYARTLIDGWATLFVSIHSLAAHRMYMHASQLTSNQRMIQTLLKDARQMTILRQFGQIAREHFGTAPGSSNHVKRLVQNFYDTAGDWERHMKHTRRSCVDSLFVKSAAPPIHRQKWTLIN